MTSLAPDKVLSLPKALPHQLPILLDPARNKVVVCGRRWGKSACGLLATVRGHGPHRGARKGAIDGGKIWWVAPDYPTASEIWRDLKKACREVWTHKDEVERRVELPSGGSVTVKSAHDPDSLVAVGLDGVVIDEAAKVKSAAWYGSLRPTLSDRGGWAIFISTPKGHNWFYDLFQFSATDDGRKNDWARWQRPSSENPLIPASELAAAKLDSPRYYDQEYEAKFVSMEGAEWPPEYFDGPGFWFDTWPGALQIKTMALDPSKGREAKRGDWQAFIKAGLGIDGCLYVEADLRRQDVEAMVQTGVEMYKAFAPEGFAVETNQFQSLLAPEFRRLGKAVGLEHLRIYPVVNTVNKDVRIRRLTSYLAQRRIRFKAGSRSTQELVQQLRDFPNGEHDDGPDCLEVAVRLMTELYSGRGKK